MHVAPVTRLPFPERGYVVSVPKSRALDARSVVVRENGVRVTGVRVDPLAGSGLRYGVVLALDASESMTGGPAAAALDGRAHVPRAPERDRGDRHRRLQRRDLGAQQPDEGRQRAPADAGDAAAARLRDAHSRRDHALARAPSRREALVRVDRAALGRCRHRQPPYAGAGGRRGEEAAGARLHRRSPLGRVRRGAAALARRAHGRLVRRGPVGRRARGDLRGARHPARGRVPRPLPLRRAPDVAGGGPDRGREGRERRPRRMSRRRRRCWRRTTAHRSRRSCSPAARRSCSRSSSGCSCAGCCCC